jgi:acyl-CoA synthetase (AMP-forming)/AMP-acid ligase II/thioesterase domain-containing protein/acyl carrier protein
MKRTRELPSQMDPNAPAHPEKSIHELLGVRAERTPGAIAIAAPGRNPLTYGSLYTLVEHAVNTLNTMGVGRNDRVAIVLPNGPEMAAAFLAVSSGATSAPLNPAYGAREFEFYLSDLNAKALLVQPGMDSSARVVARALGIPILDLAPALEAQAGLFTFESGERANTAEGGFAQSGDVALVLHTSGTTSRPKIVPLTHTNLCTSAHNIRVAYDLVGGDRCLNVMPLYHIHGLVAGVLSTMAAGASVVCTPGFDASRFFDWLESSRPTWYTAVPTMHQAILNQAESNRELIGRCPLRFIRSCSASLSPKVMAELEQIFYVPALEAYGMTEAAHQMTSNPLPPGRRKSGSVGVPTGPEVAIMGEAGDLLAAGKVGEIVIRGANVMQAYQNNPEANERAFVNGWFRTGDQGCFDEDGYLYITGRIKEIINRGGEKVAPREVDEALLEHPAVAQAVTFAVPHTTLGEDVAAAVVLRENSSTTERELREVAFHRLADFKVPSQVVIVAEIPKGPTGKLQRIGLAEKLASRLTAEFVAPRNPTEEALVEIWTEVLNVARVGVHDNFFALGGHSLLAMRLVAQIKRVFSTDLPTAALFQAPTVEQLADLLQRDKKQQAEAWSALVAIQPAGSKPPLFFVPGNLGNVFTDLGPLARHLSPDQPFYGLQDGIQNPIRIEGLAARYLGEIRTLQPEGPYLLGGVCSGGVVAFEMAQQLQAQGQQVSLLALVEPSRPRVQNLGNYVGHATSIFRRFRRRIGYHARRAAQQPAVRQRAYLRLKLKVVANTWAVVRYAPRPFSGHIDLFLTGETLRSPDHPRLGWRKLAVGGAQVHEIPGNHAMITRIGDTPIEEAHLQVLGEKLGICLDGALMDSSY